MLYAICMLCAICCMLLCYCYVLYYVCCMYAIAVCDCLMTYVCYMLFVCCMLLLYAMMLFVCRMLLLMLYAIAVCYDAICMPYAIAVCCMLLLYAMMLFVCRMLLLYAVCYLYTVLRGQRCMLLRGGCPIALSTDTWAQFNRAVIHLSISFSLSRSPSDICICFNRQGVNHIHSQLLTLRMLSQYRLYPYVDGTQLYKWRAGTLWCWPIYYDLVGGRAGTAVTTSWVVAAGVTVQVLLRFFSRPCWAIR
jgi:hypothetical protein